jgi:hypothetical protein
MNNKHKLTSKQGQIRIPHPILRVKSPRTRSETLNSRTNNTKQRTVKQVE